MNISGQHSTLLPGYGPGGHLALTVGGGGQGAMTVSGGAQALLGAQVIVGRDAGGQGSFTLTGPNSVLASYGAGGEEISGLTVASSGAGTFTVSNKAAAYVASPVIVGQNAGSLGTINVDGVGTNLFATTLAVAAGGSGNFNVTGGAVVSPSSTVTVGRDAGSSGNVAIDGAGSRLSSSSNFTVGNDGTGQVSVTGAGALVGDHTNLTVGANAGSHGAISVSGQGSLVAVTNGFVRVGERGTGALDVGSGGTVNSVNVVLGDSPGAVGGATISGTGSNLSVASNLYVGNHGIGTLTIKDGGQVTDLHGIASIGKGSSLTIQNGTLSAYQIINYGDIANDGLINGMVANEGTITGTGTINGPLLQYAGMVSPGDSPGTLTVGQANLYGGALQFEINSAGGTAGHPTGWSLLDSQSTASLSDFITLDVISLNQSNVRGDLFDFNPAHDYHWTFLTTNAGISQFDPAHFAIDTSGFHNPFGGTFYVSQVGNSLQLNYSVPEPSSAVLALLAVGLLAFRRRRAR